MELLIDFLAVNFLCCVKFEEKIKVVNCIVWQIASYHGFVS